MKRLWVPTVSLALWLAIFAGLVVTNWRVVLINADGDPCLHRRIGDWMIEHREVLHRDQFSHTRPDALLISKEWLSEVVYSAAGRVAGWNGFVVLAAALIATTLWLLLRQLLAEGDEMLLSTGLVFLAAMTCSTHWIARPHLVTHLLTVVFGWQLRQFEVGKISGKRLLLMLTPLMCLWTNLHGAFFTGFVLIGIYLVGTCSRTFGWVMLTCLAASLINPNGWRLHEQVLQFLRTPELAGMANEFRSPNFHSGGTRGFVLELLVLGGMLLVVRPKLSHTEILLLGIWGYFALHSVRNVPIFALVATPILARHWNAYLQSQDAQLYRRLSTRATELQRSADGRMLAVVLVAAILAGTHFLKTELLPSRFPVAAVNWLKTNETMVTGEMFNDYGWGGYLMWELPGRKVFTDGRNDFYGKELVDEFNTVDDTKPGWEAVFDKYRVGWTILPVNHSLNALLAMKPGWQREYGDDVAVIYVRR